MADIKNIKNLIENGDYTLTDEQIANVRLCHKKKMTEELYDFIQSRLAEYKAQLEDQLEH